MKITGWKGHSELSLRFASLFCWIRCTNWDAPGILKPGLQEEKGALRLQLTKGELMTGRNRMGWIGAFALVAGCVWAAAQKQSDQNVPDAPSATRPAQTFPTVPPSSGPPLPSRPEDAPKDNEAPPGGPAETTNPKPAPPVNIRTVPEGGATPDNSPGQETLYKLSVDINQVMVPVTIKDENGQMVSGVLPSEVSVFEDGKKQELNFFTSDPFALSAAVVFDLSMSDAAVQKVNQTFQSLEAAFSQFDEVSLYVYASGVTKMTDFGAVGKKLSAVLGDLKAVRGRNTGVPVTGGPFGQQGPVINGRPVDPSVPTVSTPPRESHVINDAILQAALDLNKRDKARRRVIFIISDGREYGSQASYSDVLKVLLSNNIMVYGIGVEAAAIPGYGKLERLHLPKFGTGNILPKYANATGGEIYNHFSREGIEQAYARVLGEARYQYTLGYRTRATPSSVYRQIEVRVGNHGPSCRSGYSPCIDVIAKDGYYPLAVTH